MREGIRRNPPGRAGEPGLSVAVALIVGTAELLGLFAGQLQWRGGFWDWVAGLDLNAISFVIVGIFAVTWLVALLVWRVGRIEQRWTAQPNGLERLV
jgi:high-affinity nickel-transport protein